eukprot:Nk52_evm30s356 gene=Nk52_evmTU30s356
MSDEEVRAECLKELKEWDSIMEPGVYNTLSRYVKAGGNPALVVAGLADSYYGYAEMCSLMGEWLDELSTSSSKAGEGGVGMGMGTSTMMLGGVEDGELSKSMNLSESAAGKNWKDKTATATGTVEDVVEDLLRKKFDSSVADSVLMNEQKDPLWLESMISFRRWRNLIYELSEKFRNCVLLQLAIQRISDAGFQAEMGGVTSVSDFLEVFNGVLIEHLTSIHSCIYTELVLKELIKCNACPSAMRRLCQEMESYIVKDSKSRDMIKFVLMLQGCGSHPRVMEAVYSMLNAGALNPGDGTVLYQEYTRSPARPPANIIRSQEFIELLIGSLFNSQKPVNATHKPKYMHILACATCMGDEEVKDLASMDALVKKTLAALEAVHSICMAKNEVFANQRSEASIKTASELCEYAKIPIAAACIIHWASDAILFDETYFTSHFKTSSIPIHFIIFDEIASKHPLLHVKLLSLYKKVFEREHGLEPLVSVELKKTVLQRLLVLCAYGYSLEVIDYIHSSMSANTIDRSLIRFFLMNLMKMVSSPYSSSFVGSLVQMLMNEDVVEAMTFSESKATVAQFLSECLAQKNQVNAPHMLLSVDQIGFIENVIHRFK